MNQIENATMFARFLKENFPHDNIICYTLIVPNLLYKYIDHKMLFNIVSYINNTSRNILCYFTENGFIHIYDHNEVKICETNDYNTFVDKYMEFVNPKEVQKIY